MVVMSDKMKKYFDKIEKEVKVIFDFANKAKKIGVDPATHVESPPAKDMAGRVEKLVGPEGIGDLLRDWKKNGMGQDELVFRAMDQVLEGKIKPSSDDFNKENAIDLAIRLALAIKTEGVVSAPLEGIEKIILRENKLGGDPYLALYYAGPIRAAGGTVQALSVLFAEHAREKMGIAKWEATPEEVDRYVEEVKLYDQILNLQYPSKPEELKFAAEHLNIELNGQPTEQREVSAYRDLPRIDTNRVRGGPCLVLNDGLLLKSKKILRVIDGMGIKGWDWLYKLKKLAHADKDEVLEEEEEEKDKQKDYGGDTYKGNKEKEEVALEKEEEEEEQTPFVLRKKRLDEKIPPLDKFVADVIAGRPVFSGPSAIGGHRVRYGRSRNTGLAACGNHPSQMILLDKFMAVGTQIRIERPGKSGSTMPVSSIEPPVVLMKNGDVKQLWNIRRAGKIVNNRSCEKILFLGDILFGVGEFVENNHTIMPSGYVEEWWALELEEAMKKQKNAQELDFNSFPDCLTEENLQYFVENPLDVNNPPTGRQALEISTKFDIGIHPRYLDHWGNINGSELIDLRKAIEIALMKCLNEKGIQEKYADSIHISSSINDHTIIDLSKFTRDQMEELTQNGLKLPNENKFKAPLEKVFCIHDCRKDFLKIPKHRALIFMEMFGFGKRSQLTSDEDFEVLYKQAEKKTGLALFPYLTSLKVPDKSPYYMGTRMGRPEKAKPRKMRPPVHTLFPIGHDSSLQRSFKKAIKRKSIKVEVCQKECPKCGDITFLNKCPNCNTVTKLRKVCPKCNQIFKPDQDECPNCKMYLKYSIYRRLPLKKFYNRASSHIRKKIPDIKGVKGMTSEFKIPEPIEKGILRALHEVWVYKDGTIRADATDIPLTHFTCKDIDVSVEKIRELGYDFDIYGAPIENEEQIIELKCQDILLTDHLADYFVRVAKFVDDELKYLYNQKKFYNAKTRYDLIGEYMVGLAPHTSAGIIGRLIGFTKANSGYAHPFWHAAKRRNCDGDEDGIMLLMDCLLNFSMYNLPSKLGGKMDAPLVISILLDPREVDGEAHNVDYMSKYPLKFYKDSQKYPKPGKLDYIKLYKDFLDTEKQFEGCMFTHPTTSINIGPKHSAYTEYGSMADKIGAQMWLAKVIVGIDEAYVANKIIGSHFVPDILGNLRSFSTQGFRCTKCGEKYRRVPLSGVCRECGADSLILTVHPGGIKKYLNQAKSMIGEFDLGTYMKQRWKLIEMQVESLTNNPRVKQTSISSFFK